MENEAKYGSYQTQALKTIHFLMDTKHYVFYPPSLFLSTPLTHTLPPSQVVLVYQWR